MSELNKQSEQDRRTGGVSDDSFVANVHNPKASSTGPEDKFVLRAFLDVKKEINDYQKRTSSEMEAINKKVEKQDEKVRASEKQLQLSQSRIIQTLAIFVALFSFVSIEFQFFKNGLLNTMQVLGLTLIICATLVFFNIALRVLISEVDEYNDRNFWEGRNVSGLVGVVMLFTVLGSLLYAYGYDNNKYEYDKFREQIKEEVLNEIKKEE